MSDLWPSVDIVYVTAECIVGLGSVLGNALVLLAIYRTRALRTVTNCFIASLAIADMLVGLVIVPVAVLPKSGLPKDFHGCVLLNTAVVLITNISILSLVDVALERYIAISDPFRYERIMSKKRALVVVIITWIIAILLGLIPTLGWNLGSDGFERCEFTKVIDMKYMVYLIFFGVNIPPLLFMLVIYLYIFYIIRKQQKRMVAQMRVLSREERKNQQNRRREVRGAKGLAYVIILFAVCWVPLHVLNSISLFSPQTVIEFKYYYQTLLFCIVLSHVNSMINPFLYAFSNSKFKRAMRKIICCGKMQSAYSSEQDSEMDSVMRSRAASRVPATASNGSAVTAAKPTPAVAVETKPPLTAATNGNGHVNVAFDQDSESDSDSEDENLKKKTLTWDEPLALQNKAYTPVEPNPQSQQQVAGAVPDSSDTEDAVIVIGNDHANENDGVSRSPGHVWATPSSQHFDQQDFAVAADLNQNQSGPEQNNEHTENNTESPVDFMLPPPSHDHSPSTQSSLEARNSDSASGVLDTAQRPPSDQTIYANTNPYIVTDRDHENGEREEEARSVFSVGVNSDTRKVVGDVENDIDIHETELEPVVNSRPSFQQQVSVTGVTVQTDPNHLQHTVKENGEKMSVTFSVCSPTDDGVSQTNEFGSKEYVSIRL